jgi:hypothetical protein
LFSTASAPAAAVNSRIIVYDYSRMLPDAGTIGHRFNITILLARLLYRRPEELRPVTASGPHGKIKLQKLA